jgi:hypothetical protein
MMMSPLLKVRSPTRQGFGQNSAESAQLPGFFAPPCKPGCARRSDNRKGMENPKIPQVARSFVDLSKNNQLSESDQHSDGCGFA